MGKMFMFLAFMTIVFSVAGFILAGMAVDMASTRLTATIDDNDTTLHVASTTGFASVGIIVIGDEHIAYSGKTSDTFHGSFVNPMLRGTEDTEAASHASGAIVRTKLGSLFNLSSDYYTAVLSDAAGAQAFIAKPVAFFQLVGSFMFVNLKFLGTDLQVLTMVWAVFGIGTLVALVVTLAGGRRV